MLYVLQMICMYKCFGIGMPSTACWTTSPSTFCVCAWRTELPCCVLLFFAAVANRQDAAAVHKTAAQRPQSTGTLGRAVDAVMGGRRRPAQRPG